MDEKPNIFQHQGGSESDIPGMAFSWSLFWADLLRMAESCQPLMKEKPWLWIVSGFSLCFSDQVLWELVPSPIDNLPAFESLVDIRQDTTFRSPYALRDPHPGPITWQSPSLFHVGNIIHEASHHYGTKDLANMASWMGWAGWFFSVWNNGPFRNYTGDTTWDIQWGGMMVDWIGVSVPQWPCPLQVSELWCSIQV